MDLPAATDKRLARDLILDELFDLSLYKSLRTISADEDARQTLDELILVETQHLAFWQKFFSDKLDRLNLGRRLKLQAMILCCRVFGTTAIHLVLEAIEIHGVRKYLSLWTHHRGQPLGQALRGILMDEFKHEDQLVSRLTERKINPENIRNIFLGLNDGLVEILGAVSGFFGAFGSPSMVLLAASTTAVAGAISMGAGAYLALNSEAEVRSTQLAKLRFLNESNERESDGAPPLPAALVVGAAYFSGALVPVLPVLFGAKTALVSIITAGLIVILVSTVLSFLAGMDVKRRIAMNLVILTLAVSVSYGIGLAVNALWGVSF